MDCRVTDRQATRVFGRNTYILGAGFTVNMNGDEESGAEEGVGANEAWVQITPRQGEGRWREKKRRRMWIQFTVGRGRQRIRPRSSKEKWTGEGSGRWFKCSRKTDRWFGLNSRAVWHRYMYSIYRGGRCTLHEETKRNGRERLRFVLDEEGTTASGRYKTRATRIHTYVINARAHTRTHTDTNAHNTRTFPQKGEIKYFSFAVFLSVYT